VVLVVVYYGAKIYPYVLYSICADPKNEDPCDDVRT
jgi:hypothetical protein